MKTKSYHLLVNAAGQLMQQHAFDHLPDEKLARMQGCLQKLGAGGIHEDLSGIASELLNYCKEVNLFVETTTPQSQQQWYAIMSSYGQGIMPILEEVE